jgi:hypothetical protein
VQLGCVSDLRLDHRTGGVALAVGYALLGLALFALATVAIVGSLLIALAAMGLGGSFLS